MNCKACGAPLARSARGRTPEYCNDRCRKAGQRNRERATQLELALETDVTKSEKAIGEPGTLCSTAWDGPAWTVRHEPSTSEPGGYDTPGNYWCAACGLHRELMDLGARLNWPEIFYFPDNSPGLQLTMVLPGVENWKSYVRGRGRDAVHTVHDRAQYELGKRERAERYESNQQRG